ncbi:hypothetical protein NL676_025642 [Syzygium grande]|nr:hypothetical protein NL676_025642 [Syzygium grande]
MKASHHGLKDKLMIDFARLGSPEEGRKLLDSSKKHRTSRCGMETVKTPGRKLSQFVALRWSSSLEALTISYGDAKEHRCGGGSPEESRFGWREHPAKRGRER